MPTVFETLMDRGMRNMEAALPPDTVAIGAETYPGVFSEVGLLDSPELGGFMTDASATFTVRKSALPEPPPTGAKVIRAGRTYKVAKVTSDTTSHTIELVDPAK